MNHAKKDQLFIYYIRSNNTTLPSEIDTRINSVNDERHHLHYDESFGVRKQMNEIYK